MTTGDENHNSKKLAVIKPWYSKVCYPSGASYELKLYQVRLMTDGVSIRTPFLCYARAPSLVERGRKALQYQSWLDIVYSVASVLSHPAQTIHVHVEPIPGHLLFGDRWAPL